MPAPHAHYDRAGLTGKELIFKTLRHEPTPAIPWVPFAGVHVGLLKGHSARAVLTDPDTGKSAIAKGARVIQHKNKRGDTHQRIVDRLHGDGDRGHVGVAADGGHPPAG